MTEIRFIADAMLGKLSTWLRMLGFDTLYLRTSDDDLLIARALGEKRRLLTRKTQLIRHRELGDYLFFIADNDPLRQLKEVIEHYHLTSVPHAAFTRCLICNHRLTQVEPAQVGSLLPDYVKNSHKHFSICPGCQRVFWRGTHYENMRNILERLSFPLYVIP